MMTRIATSFILTIWALEGYQKLFDLTYITKLVIRKAILITVSSTLLRGLLLTFRVFSSIALKHLVLQNCEIFLLYCFSNLN